MAGPAPQPAHRGLHWRIWLAEGAGTATLLVGGLSAVALDFGPGSPVADVVPSHSLRLLITGLLFAGTGSLVAISPFGRLSGAHLNPSVTLPFRVLGRVSPHDVAGYVSAQLTGALLGAALVSLVWGSTATAVHGGATEPVGVALGLEAAMTAVLIAVLLGCVAHRRLARFTPLVLWPLIAVMVWQVADYTGTSLNPARSIGPALVFGVSHQLWIYLLAPPAGALLVGVGWRFGMRRRPPLTAKLFHDPRYASSMACTLPAMHAKTTRGGMMRPALDGPQSPSRWPMGEQPDLILRGARLLLRPVGAGDAEALAAILAEPEVARWWGVWDARRARDELVRGFVVVIDGESMGWLEFSEEADPDYRHVGFDIALATAVHGRGYGPEALRLVIRHFIGCGHHRFTIDPAVDNDRAIRTYTAVGFRPVGVMRAYERAADGGWHDNLLMDLLATELSG